MKLFDVNVLIYAHRSDQPEHAFFRDYLNDQINTLNSFALSPLVAAAFVRIVTNPRFPNGPTPLAQALATIDAISALERCYWVGPGPRHWELTTHLCRRCNSVGKQVADAQHAAIAIEHSCVWVTRDRDFAAFTPFGLQLETVAPRLGS